MTKKWYKKVSKSKKRKTMFSNKTQKKKINKYKRTFRKNKRGGSNQQNLNFLQNPNANQNQNINNDNDINFSSSSQGSLHLSDLQGESENNNNNTEDGKTTSETHSSSLNINGGRKKIKLF